MSFRTRLIFLILVGILPLFAFSVWSQITRFRENREASALQAARSTATSVAREIEIRLTALRVLAVSPELVAGDFDNFRKRAQAVVDQETPGSNLLVLRADGQQLLNTAVPQGQQLPSRVNLTSLKELFRTGAPNVSDVFMGAFLKRPVVAIEFPVKSADGHVIYGMALNPTLDSFKGVFKDRLVATNYYVIDRLGSIVAQRFGPVIMGTKLAPELLANIGSGNEGIFYGANADGSSTIFAFNKVDPFGWTVVVELRRAALTRAAIESVLPMVAVGSLVIALSLGLSTFAAKRITAGIAELRNVSEERTQDWMLLAKHPEIHAAALTIRDAHDQLRDQNIQLNRTVAERDLLLREVYHRVKNNLQMVDAMIRWESRRLSDPAALKAMENLSTRLHTIGLVHTQLMQSADLESINIAVFLEQLAKHLQVMRVGTDELVLDLTAEPLPVSIDFALPIGLLLTEIVTNAAKHASGETARVTIAFGREKDLGVVLRVHDNGTDRTAAKKFGESRNIGANIIGGVVKQLGAKMTTNSENGLLFIFSIPLPEINI